MKTVIVVLAFALLISVAQNIYQMKEYSLLSDKLMFESFIEGSPSSEPSILELTDDGPGWIILPPSLRARTIQELQDKESGWTVPWSMLVDRNGKMWLHPECPLEEAPGGTYELKVVRQGDAYSVYLSPSSDYKWEKEDRASYKGKTDVGWIPVKKLCFAR